MTKLKEFMVDQLESTISDCEILSERTPVLLSGDEFRKQEMERCVRSIRDDEADLQRAIEKYESDKRFIASVRKVVAELKKSVNITSSSGRHRK